MQLLPLVRAISLQTTSDICACRLMAGLVSFALLPTIATPVGAQIMTNLVANPSFEVPGSGNVSNWTGSALDTFAYSQGFTSGVIPPNAGQLYLTGPGSPSGNTTQSIDLLSAGFTPAILDSGGVNFSLSAYFSTFGAQNDYATITAQFFDSGNVLLGTSNPIGGPAFVSGIPRPTGLCDWAMDATGADLPVGTRSVTIDILHTRLQGTSCDSYTDLVNFQISAIPEPGSLLLSAAGGVGLVLRLRRRDTGKIG